MKMYEIMEQNGRKMTTSIQGFETEKELTAWLNGKRAMEDEKKYSIVAWIITSEGHGYIDLETIWNRAKMMKKLIKAA